MDIYFSPAYSGNVFFKTTNESVSMDAVTLNTVGLVNWLELRLGLHYSEIPQPQRVALYYDALCKYMKLHPSNLFANSFRLSGLATAKALLAWRDELCLTGWNFEGADLSDRLNVIIGTESFYKDNKEVDLASRLHIVKNQIALQKMDCSAMKIILPCPVELLKPQLRNLFDTIQQVGGAQLCIQDSAPIQQTNLGKIRMLLKANSKDQISLDDKDDSFQIYHFATDWEANRYMAHRDFSDVDVWINADNKQFDNWLTLMNRPKTGSVMNDCSPQLTQLFVMGLGLFAEPLNVQTLIEWLNMPLHPLESFFRSVLANTVAGEGGFRNDKCKEVLQKYIDGAYVYLDEEKLALPADQQAAYREKGKKQRMKNVAVFLPSFKKRSQLFVSDVQDFVTELAGWAKKKNFLLSQQHEDDLWSEQLGAVASMAESFLILLNTVDTKTVDYKQMDSWLSSIYVADDFTHAAAEKGGRMVIDSPAKMVSVSDKTVWMGFDGSESQSLECAFLCPTEKAGLIENGYICHWDEKDENGYHESMRLLPLHKTKLQLILVVCDRKGGEECMLHPLLVRLKQQVTNLDAFIKTPTFDSDELERVELVDNGGVSAEVHFDHAQHIHWPDHLSPTSISTLVEYPLDYLLEQLLNISTAQKVEMEDVKKTKGNVAHEVIAKLFGPRDGESSVCADEIEVRVRDEYEKVYHEVLEAHGAILQLAENKLTEKLLHEQLAECLESLLDILKENRLRVTGCERFVEDFMDFGLPERNDQSDSAEKMPNRDLLGFIDMTLEDAEGHLVVFDFKWTSSKHYYQDLLTSNRSIQLELYRHMLAHEQKREVDRVGYFLMPRGYLYSQEKFEGKNCHQLEPQNTDDIVLQLKESVRYRKDQLDNGVVETNGDFLDLHYVKDTPERHLFPLNEDENQGIKKENIYSNFGLFNA